MSEPVGGRFHGLFVRKCALGLVLLVQRRFVYDGCQIRWFLAGQTCCARIEMSHPVVVPGTKRLLPDQMLVLVVVLGFMQRLWIWFLKRFILRWNWRCRRWHY